MASSAVLAGALLGLLGGMSACTNGAAPSFGTRANFVPPKDECWPAVESCHDSYPICPGLCR